jgi:hypothetical protein
VIRTLEHATGKAAYMVSRARRAPLLPSVQFVAAVELPTDLAQRVEPLLREQPSLPWDIAVAMVARRLIDET